ncbi:MAG: hypothetical protein RIS36_484 [Pseudomonadota bacterium]|jgi:hypothetical protein
MSDDLFSKFNIDPEKLSEFLKGLQIPQIPLSAIELPQLQVGHQSTRRETDCLLDIDAHLIERPAITTPPTCFTRTSWSMPQREFQEFVKFLTLIDGKSPSTLSDVDINGVTGSSFRGTSFLLLIASLYCTGAAYSIRDFSAHNPEYSGEIDFRYPLASPDKIIAGRSYANKYIDSDGSLVKGFVDQESAIFDRVLKDNNHTAISFLPMLLQPILIAFDSDASNSDDHKQYEGVQYNPIPNSATLNLIACLTGLTLEEFRVRFPILARKFS